jgi:hypothetical protein
VLIDRALPRSAASPTAAYRSGNGFRPGSLGERRALGLEDCYVQLLFSGPDPRAPHIDNK